MILSVSIIITIIILVILLVVICADKSDKWLAMAKLDSLDKESSIWI